MSYNTQLITSSKNINPQGQLHFNHQNHRKWWDDVSKNNLKLNPQNTSSHINPNAPYQPINPMNSYQTITQLQPTQIPITQPQPMYTPQIQRNQNYFNQVQPRAGCGCGNAR